MAKMKIKSKKGSRLICGKTVTPYGWTHIDADELKAYAETRMGKIVLDNCIEYAPDEKSIKGKENAEQAAIRAERIADKNRITDLEAENTELKARIKDLEFKLTAKSKRTVSAKKDPDPVPMGEVEQNESEPEKVEDFTFDPARHTIEHRGRGKFFVMDENDEKVYGPLTDDEKEQYEDILKGE